jgi:hypothetical protein
MAENSIPLQFRKPAERKDQLVRGIDPIPEHYEFLAAHAAIAGLSRSLTTLERLAELARTQGRSMDARELRRARKAAVDALNAITGGFNVAEMEALSKKHPEVIRHFKRQEAMPAPGSIQ